MIGLHSATLYRFSNIFSLDVCNFIKPNHVWFLKGTDCQRYLYFVCEYDLNVTTTYDNQRLDKSFRPSEELFPIQTTSPLPVNAPSTSEAPSTTVQPLPPPPPPTPNYVGVIGFKGVSRPANVNPLNLAIFGDGIQ